jgi:hypothetical protein
MFWWLFWVLTAHQKELRPQFFGSALGFEIPSSKLLFFLNHTSSRTFQILSLYIQWRNIRMILKTRKA